VVPEADPTVPVASPVILLTPPTETPVPTVGAAVGVSAPPAPDVITTIQYVLTSVTRVVDQVVAPLIARCDLCSLLTLISGDPLPTRNGDGNSAWPSIAQNAALPSPRAARLAHPATVQGLAGLLVPPALTAELLGEAASNGLDRTVASSGYATPAPSSVVRASATSILEHALR